MNKQPHLLVCISGHGFGHVAQTAPVLNELHARMPLLRVTLRTMVPLQHLRSRIHFPFGYVRESVDIGMLMSSALDVNVKESAEAYRTQHLDWGARVMRESRELKEFEADFLLSNVAYLPLAGAFRAGIPSAAMSSLNWADIYGDYCGAVSGAHHTTKQIHVAYNGAETFLQTTPAMPMPEIYRGKRIGPVATVGENRRGELDDMLHLGVNEKLVLVSLGGVAGQLPMERWPRMEGIRWLVPSEWRTAHPDAVMIGALGLPFEDVLASCDALICKPGYGSFVEAACAGVPVLYASRPDWPETIYLAKWLGEHGIGQEVDRSSLESGHFEPSLRKLLAEPKPQPAVPTGVSEAADWLEQRLSQL
jgi:hypothetical protein